MNGMTLRDDFERLVAEWLDETAGSAPPDYLDETLGRIEHLRQRPAWLSPGRWLPMRAMTLRRFEVPRLVPYLAALALLLVLAIAIVLVAGSQRRIPPPFGIAATGSLVYDSGGDLYTVAADGIAPRRLTATTDQREFGAAWSPTGTRLAYAAVADGQRSASLWVIEADGTGARKVSGDLELSADDVQAAASWSPDAAQLAFVAGNRLHVVDADGSNLRPLAEQVAASWPSWSPRGDLIAFSGPGAAYVVSPEGGAATTVSRRSGGLIELVPNWSPDGSALVYHGGENADVFVATSSDTGWTESLLVGGVTNDSWPVFSNDGERISFLRSTAFDHGHVLIVDADGSDQRRLASGTIGWAPHCWTPDDRSILAVSAEENFGIGDEPAPGYVLLSVDGSAAAVAVPTADRQSFAACSWQRLAP